jgi:hypothetical protein
MKEAKLIACEEAKEEFFNAEILAHEITDKAIADELEALESSRAVLASLWSQRFNTAVQTNDERILPGLYEKVMDAVRDHHPQMPTVLNCGLIHAFGLIHQRVNAGKAGWVRDYKDVAQKYFDEHIPPSDSAAKDPQMSSTLDVRTAENSQHKGK